MIKHNGNFPNLDGIENGRLRSRDHAEGGARGALAPPLSCKKNKTQNKTQNKKNKEAKNAKKIR